MLWQSDVDMSRYRLSVTVALQAMGSPFRFGLCIASRCMQMLYTHDIMMLLLLLIPKPTRIYESWITAYPWMPPACVAGRPSCNSIINYRCFLITA